MLFLFFSAVFPHGKPPAAARIRGGGLSIRA